MEKRPVRNVLIQKFIIAGADEASRLRRGYPLKKIQAFASEPAHLLLGDRAGSGKTLAYLLPVMLHLRKHEIASGMRYAQSRSPAAVILAPTQELCTQVDELQKHR